ncbi:discoidin domain-containing protein [Mycobacterium hubeiense]|uniref:discoidin domain-containing protein n=1 Tax=Mycobacterium hubeiense TaxID=1867256 RepID=UPI00130478A5|nr:discoidin domain-containing protein [Mycobacterium sp. QGD 101]
MSTEVSDPVTAAGELPDTDVFLACRRRILAAVAPGPAAAADGPPEPPHAPVEPDTAFEDAAPDSAEVDDFDDDYAANPAGFLQFPSADDLNDDPLDDDEDDDELQPAPLPTRDRSLKQRARDIEWRSPKVIIGALSAVVLFAVLVIVLKPEPAPPTLTINSAPPPTSAPPPPVPVDQPIKIESATSKCPAGSAEETNAFDGQNATAWTCKMTYGPGQILTIDLGDVYVISKVTIIPGFHKVSSSGDEWDKYQTITRVRWLFGDYSPAKPCTLDNNCLEQNTNNTREVVPTAVIPNKKSSTVKLVVLQTTPPPSQSGLLPDPNGGADSFATSEIQIWGHPAE